MNIQDKLLAEYVCKVYKNPEKHDDRTLLCGSPVCRDRKGEHFIIPAHQADYISNIFPQYDVGKPYIPKKKAESKSEEE